MRAVGACSSSAVMAGLSASVLPGRSTGDRRTGPPGTPGDPSRRAGSQGAAQQRILPLLERAVHIGGPHARGTTPGRGSRPAGPGRAVVDGSPMMPVPGLSWGRHARENPGKDPGDRVLLTSASPQRAQGVGAGTWRRRCLDGASRRLAGSARAAGRGRESVSCAPRPAEPDSSTSSPGPGPRRPPRPSRPRRCPALGRRCDTRTTQGPPSGWRTAPAGRARWWVHHPASAGCRVT